MSHEFEDAADLAVQAAPDFADLLDTTEDYLLERWEITFPVARQIAEWHDAQMELAHESAQAGAFSRVIGVLLHVGGDMRVAVYGLAFATGMNRLLKWPTMSAAAEGLGVSRAAISKRAVQWADLLGLKRSAHMKSDAACEKYREAQKKNHWRRAAIAKAPESVPWEE
jgi:DnaJ-domain-containing protein 1